MLEIFEEAVAAGARRARAAEVLGISVRTLERWRAVDGGEDGRRRAARSPGNKLTEAERARVLEIANSPEYRDVSPKQIVPQLADEGEYVASESTFYRVLRAEDQLQHRESRRPARARPRALVARGPNEVWSWDITYLRSAVRGRFFYLYLVMDLWSRKIVGFAVHESENQHHASALIERIVRECGIPRDQLVLHSDNGSPMKGSTMLATLQGLGIVPSFSRPGVSNDNPYSESIYGTMKGHPGYPSRPFDDLAAARAWVAAFVHWYNHVHLHSGIRFVTPADRHDGNDVVILQKRRRVYERAKAKHPERWTGATRDWSRIEEVHLNPEADRRRCADTEDRAAA